MDISDTIDGISKVSTATAESGRAFGKTALAFREATGKRLRMSKAPATYTISARGVVTRCAPWDSVPKFVPPYVPAKGSRVFPALKTCTSPRRAALARQRARREHGIITGVSPKDVRVTVNGRRCAPAYSADTGRSGADLRACGGEHAAGFATR